MYIECVEQLDKSSICDEELLQELFSLDEYDRQLKYLEITRQAKLIGMKGTWETLYRAYKKDFRRKLNSSPSRDGNNIIDFDDPELKEELVSGSWTCDDNGVYTDSDRGKVWASYHPIYPAAILVNAETSMCKVVIRFKVRGSWREIKADRSVIASNNKILSLADNGIQVTSENSKAMVKYLADIESLNPAIIKESVSTGRLGWIGKAFMPYADNVTFDNEQSLLSLFRSVKPVGKEEKWMRLMLEIRKQRRFEALIYTAASLASVLVSPCDALPFIVSIWGGTGLGKTVALMLATSIWADPSEGAYITDAKATNVAMEVRLNALNSLPMMLDDMAQIQGQYKDENFSDLIYRWCAGKGRDRSNQNLGLNKMTSWSNCTLTNGERSLVEESTQGGAVNRVIDVQIGDTAIFQNPDGNEISNTIKKHYGHCGKRFVEIIQRMEEAELRFMVNTWKERIKEASSKEITEKQLIPMALILTADEISEKEIYKDGIRLNLDECVSVLKSEKEISENERAYDYLCGMIASNSVRFSSETLGEKWGSFINDNTRDEVYIIGTQFDKLLKDGGFQPKAFTSWALKNGYVHRFADRTRSKVKIDNVWTRCLHFILDKESVAEIEDAIH